eukprot:m.337607 g.337607  ORF g.337607 m.337607 type:complete len:380 (-) comp18180_c0_seq1:644-1783(-)
MAATRIHRLVTSGPCHTALQTSIRSMSTGSSRNVLVFNGDGIGPEIVQASRTVIDTTLKNFGRPSITWTEMDMGYEAEQRTGTYIGEEHLQAFDDIKILFKGPLTVPPGETKSDIHIRGRRFTSGNQVLRKVFQLFANVRPAQNFKGVASPGKNVNLVVIRENTEDVYSGMESWADDDTVHCIKVITRGASERIARFSLDYAKKHNRTRVTCVHKANVCKVSDGLFLSTFRDTAKAPEYDGLFRADDHLADSLLTRLVQAPHEFDVLCCPNLFGDLVSDMCGGLIGSLGLCPSGNFGEEHVMFEPAHGSAPDIAGKGIANPTSQLLSGAMMLDHLGEHDSAESIRNAVEKSFLANCIPKDLGGSANTEEFISSVLKNLA